MTHHKYLYANGSPVNFVDPSGNWSKEATLATIAVVGIIAAALVLPSTLNSWVGNIFGWFGGSRLEVVDEPIIVSGSAWDSDRIGAMNAYDEAKRFWALWAGIYIVSYPWRSLPACSATLPLCMLASPVGSYIASFPALAALRMQLQQEMVIPTHVTIFADSIESTWYDEKYGRTFNQPPHTPLTPYKAVTFLAYSAKIYPGLILAHEYGHSFGLEGHYFNRNLMWGGRVLIDAHITTGQLDTVRSYVSKNY